MTSSTSRLLKDKKDLKFYQISERGRCEFQAWHQEDSIHKWEASFNCEGMFSDKYVRVELVFPRNYPFIGPSIKVFTQLNHSCIGENGSINLFNECWTPAFNLGAIILMIKAFLSEDYTEFNRQKSRTDFFKNELIVKSHHRCDY